MKMNVRPVVHRGYDTKEKKMLSANELTDLGVKLKPNGEWENIEGIVLMQFVMREDDNGVPIFENDIVDIDIETELGRIRSRGVMQWDPEANAFQMKVRAGNTGTGIATNMNVVGNIFEHKDLLDEEADLPK